MTPPEFFLAHLKQDELLSSPSKWLTELTFGHPYRALGAGIIIESPSQIINGINLVWKHPAGPLEIVGFFKFEDLRQFKGNHYYRGRPIIVDPDRAILTDQEYNRSMIISGEVKGLN